MWRTHPHLAGRLCPLFAAGRTAGGLSGRRRICRRPEGQCPSACPICLPHQPAPSACPICLPLCLTLAGGVHGQQAIQLLLQTATRGPQQRWWCWQTLATAGKQAGLGWLCLAGMRAGGHALCSTPPQAPPRPTPTQHTSAMALMWPAQSPHFSAHSAISSCQKTACADPFRPRWVRVEVKAPPDRPLRGVTLGRMTPRSSRPCATPAGSGSRSGRALLCGECGCGAAPSQQAGGGGGRGSGGPAYRQAGSF